MYQPDRFKSSNIIMLKINYATSILELRYSKVLYSLMLRWEKRCILYSLIGFSKFLRKLTLKIVEVRAREEFIILFKFLCIILSKWKIWICTVSYSLFTVFTYKHQKLIIMKLCISILYNILNECINILYKTLYEYP